MAHQLASPGTRDAIDHHEPDVRFGRLDQGRVRIWIDTSDDDEVGTLSDRDRPDQSPPAEDVRGDAGHAGDEVRVEIGAFVARATARAHFSSPSRFRLPVTVQLEPRPSRTPNPAAAATSAVLP